MTRIAINGSETGVVRVFHLDLPSEAVERFTVQAGTGEWPLKYGLGAEKLRAAFIEIVDLADLGSMALSAYLSEGYGVSRAALKAEKDRLDGLRGHVLILPSTAFDNHTQDLTIATPLKFIGAFGEDKPTGRGAPIRSKAAKGVLTGNAQASPMRIPPLAIAALVGLGVFALFLAAWGLK